MPLLAGFVLSRIVADPLFVVVESRAPMAFAPTDAQKVRRTARMLVRADTIHRYTTGCIGPR